MVQLPESLNINYTVTITKNSRYLAGISSHEHSHSHQIYMKPRTESQDGYGIHLSLADIY